MLPGCFALSRLSTALQNSFLPVLLFAIIFSGPNRANAADPQDILPADTQIVAHVQDFNEWLSQPANHPTLKFWDAQALLRSSFRSIFDEGAPAVTSFSDFRQIAEDVKLTAGLPEGFTRAMRLSVPDPARPKVVIEDLFFGLTEYDRETLPAFLGQFGLFLSGQQADEVLITPLTQALTEDVDFKLVIVEENTTREFLATIRNGFLWIANSSAASGLQEEIQKRVIGIASKKAILARDQSFREAISNIQPDAEAWAYVNAHKTLETLAQSLLSPKRQNNERAEYDLLFRELGLAEIHSLFASVTLDEGGAKLSIETNLSGDVGYLSSVLTDYNPYQRLEEKPVPSSGLAAMHLSTYNGAPDLIQGLMRIEKSARELKGSRSKTHQFFEKNVLRATDFLTLAGSRSSKRSLPLRNVLELADIASRAYGAGSSWLWGAINSDTAGRAIAAPIAEFSVLSPENIAALKAAFLTEMDEVQEKGLFSLTERNAPDLPGTVEPVINSGRWQNAVQWAPVFAPSWTTGCDEVIVGEALHVFSLGSSEWLESHLRQSAEGTLQPARETEPFQEGQALLSSDTGQERMVAFTWCDLQTGLYTIGDGAMNVIADDSSANSETRVHLAPLDGINADLYAARFLSAQRVRDVIYIGRRP